MNKLSVGFARLDITPPMGVGLQGYSAKRYADGILDPLLVTAVCFDDGVKRAVVISMDLIGCSQLIMKDLRPLVAEAIHTDVEGVFISCTHTHLGPGLATPDEVLWPGNEFYVSWLMQKVRDVAVFAMEDLAPATQMSYTRGKTEDVAFIRRYRMKDGSIRTNPGYLNPDIDHPIGTPDETSSLLIIKRENAPEIGIVNFQVHPDSIGGCKISADFPKFVRDTYEALIENSRCMYLNGAQGDLAGGNLMLTADKCRKGYPRARYRGRRRAMSVLDNYDYAEPLSGTEIHYGQKNIHVGFNKGRPDQLDEAMRIMKLFREGGPDAIGPESMGMARTEIIGEADRIVRNMTMPDEKELHVTALAVGDVVFAGFPGEPFTQMGRDVKAASKFTLTMPVCAANGYEGYYPTQDAYDEDGYEVKTARYVRGTAEKIVATSIEIINNF